jgi:hypothetical protein
MNSHAENLSPSDVSRRAAKLNATVPAEFLIAACAPDRADRFATATEMREALREIRDEL